MDLHSADKSHAVAGWSKALRGSLAHLAIAGPGIRAVTRARAAVPSGEVLNVAAHLAVARAGVAGASGAGVAVFGRDHQGIGLGQEGRSSEGGD